MRIALPKGRLMGETIKVLKLAGLGLSGYREGARIYHLTSEKSPDLSAKILHEKDIPIQVATGNYDLGISGEDWVDELLTKYPASAVIKVKNLGYGEETLYAASFAGGDIKTLGDASRKEKTIRIAGEYPNLAESLAGKIRLRRFKIYPLWGAAEAYPPETADIILVLKKSEEDISAGGLKPLSRVSPAKAFLIANRRSWESGDMSGILAALTEALTTYEALPGMKEKRADLKTKADFPGFTKPWGNLTDDTIRLALPDGHQESHVSRILAAAGVSITDYPSETGNYRPKSSLDGVVIKVIRPQDMPVQVASGNFDLAITGQDWLTDHLYQFPGSPVKELTNLKYGRVRVVAAVSQNLAADDIQGLRSLYTRSGGWLRIASEYVNIADRYARSNHLGMYRIIPTWGTTEAFIPEDADLLIENTETGRTLTQNNLKIVDTLFESTACLIGSASEITNATKKKKIASLTEILKRAVEAL